jgi:hypothetical protein
VLVIVEDISFAGSLYIVVHIHVMKKKRRSTHAEGADDSEDYIASEGVKLQREHADSEWA